MIFSKIFAQVMVLRWIKEILAMPASFLKLMIFPPQVMALRWIKENIHSFGGDPDAITLFSGKMYGTKFYHHQKTNECMNL